MILLNTKCDIEVAKCEKSNHGRFLILDTKANDTNLVLTNIYAPTDISQQVESFEKITNELSNYADENIVFGGDYNRPLTVSDRTRGNPVETKKLCDKQYFQSLFIPFEMYGA